MMMMMMMMMMRRRRMMMMMIIEDDGAKEATEANYIRIQHILPLLSWRNFKAIRFG